MIYRPTTWLGLAAPCYVLGRDGTAVLVDSIVSDWTRGAVATLVVTVGGQPWTVDANAPVVTIEPTEPEALVTLFTAFPGAEVIS